MYFDALGSSGTENTPTEPWIQSYRINFLIFPYNKDFKECSSVIAENTDRTTVSKGCARLSSWTDQTCVYKLTYYREAGIMGKREYNLYWQKYLLWLRIGCYIWLHMNMINMSIGKQANTWNIYI